MAKVNYQYEKRQKELEKKKKKEQKLNRKLEKKVVQPKENPVQVSDKVYYKNRDQDLSDWSLFFLVTLCGAKENVLQTN